MQDFKKLKVWQKTQDMIVSVDALCRELPRSEIYGLASQMRRAASSVSLNIAEGSGCASQLEYLRFLSFAFRSACEVEAAMRECSLRFQLDIKPPLEKAIEVKKMLCGLRRRIRSDLRWRL